MCVWGGGAKGGREERKKKRKREEMKRARAVLFAVRHGVIKASHGFLWVKEEEDGRENGD